MKVRRKCAGSQRTVVVQTRKNPIGRPFHHVLGGNTAEVHFLGAPHQQCQFLLNALHLDEIAPRI